MAALLGIQGCRVSIHLTAGLYINFWTYLPSRTSTLKIYLPRLKYNLSEYFMINMLYIHIRKNNWNNTKLKKKSLTLFLIQQFCSRQRLSKIFCQKLEILYNWIDNLCLEAGNIVAKREIALSNLFFYSYVFKKPSAAEASESIYMRYRVKVTELFIERTDMQMNYQFSQCMSRRQFSVFLSWLESFFFVGRYMWYTYFMTVHWK